MDIDEDVPTTRPWQRTLGLLGALAVLLGVPGFIFVIVTYCMILHYDLTHRQLTFAAGDEPDDTDAVCGPVGPGPDGTDACLADAWTWQLPPGRSVNVTVRPANPDTARGLKGDLSIEDCAGSSVDWHLDGDGEIFAVGTLADRSPKHKLTERLNHGIRQLTLVAVRTDAAPCTAKLRWAPAAIEPKTWWWW